MLSSSVNMSMIRQEIMALYNNKIASFKSSGRSDNFFMNFKEMCLSDQNIYNEYYQKAYLLFNQAGILTQENAKNYDIITFYGMAMSGMFMSYNLKNGKIEIFTSSVSALNRLNSKSMLVKRDGSMVDMQTIINRLGVVDGKMSKSIKDSLNDGDSFIALKLEPKYNGKSMKYIASFPRPTRKLSDHVIVQWDSLETGVNAFRSLAENLLLTVNIVRPDGDIDERYITRNAGILGTYYEKDRVDSLIRSSSNYSLVQNRNYLPSVGASIFSVGLSNISPFYVDSISVCSKPNIDTSLINYDFSVVLQFFMDSLAGMPQEALARVCTALKIETDAQSRFQIETQIKQTVLNVRNTKLYKFMEQNPDLFDIQALRQKKKTYVHNIKRIAVPQTDNELKQLLKSNICRMKIKKTNGTSIIRDVTNSGQHLQAVYGSGYIAEFESENNRRKYLIKLFESHKGEMNGRVLKSYCANAGLQEIYNEIADFALEDGAVSEQNYEVEKLNFIEIVRSGINDKKQAGSFGSVTARYTDLVTGHSDSIRQTFYISIIRENIEELYVIS